MWVDYKPRRCRVWMMVINEFFHVFEMWIGMKVFDHRIDQILSFQSAFQIHEKILVLPLSTFFLLNRKFKDAVGLLS